MNLDWLKSNCQAIHYFGLGFIQLKIDKCRRMHFYAKELPPIVPEEDIHNHRYDFTSKILSGTLIQEVYEIVPGDTHLLGDETCQEGVEAESDLKPCGVKLCGRHKHVAGGEYFIDHGVFHRVSCPDYCITFLERTDYKKSLAQVVRPAGVEKICPFGRKIDEGTLWGIVDKMLALPGSLDAVASRAVANPCDRDAAGAAAVL